MEIRQSEDYVDKDWWRWSVWLDGTKQDLDKIAAVEWRLHPSFPEPVRKTSDRKNKFRLDTAGWGVFMINAAVTMKDGSVTKLRHHLQLHYPDGTATTA
jgi:transcription initiation factor IIF auxiliary subunit